MEKPNVDSEVLVEERPKKDGFRCAKIFRWVRDENGSSSKPYNGPCQYHIRDQETCNRECEFDKRLFDKSRNKDNVLEAELDSESP